MDAISEKCPAYAELHAISNFSFLRGASHPQELVARAKELGYRALALTDECSLAGVVRAHMAAQEYGLHLIVGSEFALADDARLVLLAPDRAAYGDLSELITRARRDAEKGSYRIAPEDVAPHAARCLALWVAGTVAEVTALDPWHQIFPDRLWIAVESHFDGSDRARLARLQALGMRTGVRLVAAGNVQMHKRRRKQLHDVLTAIRLGTTVQSAGQALVPNSERALRTRSTLAQLYPAELLEETCRIAERCTFSLSELRYEYPQELVPPDRTPTEHLRELTEAGARRRWPQGITSAVRASIERELALIAELRYEPYFLTVHDMVRYARARGILCQGRGSAANSAVCFCLGITEVDPARMDTLFERFISRERNEPPDIDVDFEHERREEVIQYIYAKYGRQRAALAAAVITYRSRSAVRDVAKALGFAPDQVDRLAKSLQWWDEGEAQKKRLCEAGFDPKNRRLTQLIELVQTLLGFPRHLSQHVGGFVIARDSLPRLVPIENAAMPDRTVIQWDKEDLESLGLLKVDCLSLGMLTAIRKTFDLVERFRGKKHTLATLPSEDAKVYQMIQAADTIGLFQIESRAQMAMLPRLKPKEFYDLVVQIAIVRPGPIQGNMVHPYLQCREDVSKIQYPSDELIPVLKRTYGVPIFQEQVIKLAMIAADFTPGEADGLRRSIAGWRRNGGLDHYGQRLIEGMRRKGYREEYAQRIYKQIQGFGEYGFPEAHAASFALLAYASAWLKCYEPAAFLAALLNSQPMGFYAPSQLVQDARRHEVEVRAVDVCASDWDCTLERRADGAAAVRLGLRLVKGLTQAGAQRLTVARAQAAFVNVNDMAHRAALTRRDLDVLATAGALHSLAGHRHRARWAVAGVEPERPLLVGASAPEALPLLRAPTEGEDIVADYAQLELTLGRHPLTLLRAQLRAQRCASAQELQETDSGRLIRTAGIVVGRQHPQSANGTIFLTLEDETGHTNVIVWSSLVERERRAVVQARLLMVEGEVQRQGKVLHLVAHRLHDRSRWLGRLLTKSRDFH